MHFYDLKIVVCTLATLCKIKKGWLLNVWGVNNIIPSFRFSCSTFLHQQIHCTHCTNFDDLAEGISDKVVRHAFVSTKMFSFKGENNFLLLPLYRASIETLWYAATHGCPLSPWKTSSSHMPASISAPPTTPLVRTISRCTWKSAVSHSLLSTHALMVFSVVNTHHVYFYSVVIHSWMK